MQKFNGMIKEIITNFDDQINIVLNKSGQILLLPLDSVQKN